MSQYPQDPHHGYVQHPPPNGYVENQSHGYVQSSRPPYPNPVYGKHHSPSRAGTVSRKPVGSRHHRREKQHSHHGHHEISPLTGHLVAASGEFIGTVLFLWFAFAWHLTVGENAPKGTSVAETVMFVSIGYGFSLLVNAWVFYRISGGLFNPAVVVGMVLTGSLPWVRGLVLIPVELVAGIVAAALVECMFPGSINVVNTTVAPGVNTPQALFIEMFLTSLLLLAIYMLAAEKSKVTFIAPLGIGLALFIAELAGVHYTGGSLNPARSFGPAVVSGKYADGKHWIYWIGPLLGALLSAGYYKLAKVLHYEQANAGQDSADGEFV